MSLEIISDKILPKLSALNVAKEVISTWSFKDSYGHVRTSIHVIHIFLHVTIIRTKTIFSLLNILTTELLEKSRYKSILWVLLTSQFAIASVEQI